MVSKLRPGPKRITTPDPEMRGHYVRITPRGAKSFVAVARDPGGKQIWSTIGGTDVLTIGESREQARERIKRIKAGQPAVEPPPLEPDSFEVIAEIWVHRHVKAKRLRTEREILRLLNKHVYPAFGDREFETIKRSDVTKLLDLVEDGSGPRQADTVLTVLRSIMNWHATRTDDYVPPVIRGMARDDRHAKKRARILDDDEIRALWGAADTSGSFGAFVKLAILTGQRRQKIATMRWQDLTLDGTWNIPTEDREKGNGGALMLPEIAVDIIRSQKRISGNAYVFPARGGGHFNAYGPRKKSLDAKAQIAPWVIHDLRRTARSLMARAGVRSEIAERVMGHVLPGVEGIYDRHEYRKEKADALAKLAGLIALILDPPGENVVKLGASQ
ncbi:MAG: site-specific integrase [Alphaproteobacteria bacterium]|nr:site-specific integrase [Alphaproteobacteria bacterium]